MEDRKNPLYFPLNCPDAKYIINGFGIREITIIIVSFFLIAIAAIIYYLSVKNMIATVFGAGVIIVFIIMLIRKNQQQESMIDQLCLIARYHRSQKRYEYKYYNIYEARINE